MIDLEGGNMRKKLFTAMVLTYLTSIVIYGCGIDRKFWEKVFPELVQTDTEGYKSVSYGNLVAPLIEAIKDLFNKYVDQQDQIDALEARIQALEQAK